MPRFVSVSVSAAALCVSVILKQLRGSPELFPYDASFGDGGLEEESTRTWTTILLMGHLDVWAYVIESQRAASNRPSTAGIQLRDNRSAASLLHPGGHSSGNRSRQGPKASLSPSSSPSPNTHTVHTHTHTQYCPTASAAPDLTLICLWRSQQRTL